MSADLAIIAGTGALPKALTAALPQALVVHPDMARPLDQLLPELTAGLRRAGCRSVVLAGRVPRPLSDTIGDAGLSDYVIRYFESAGFELVGAHELLPELTAAPGLLAGPELSVQARQDMQRGRAILKALAAQDVGQSVVVAGGLCLGIETAQGTDAMLNFVAQPVDFKKQGGVLVKAPKAGQDLRIDMPAIGPETVRLALKAGLEAIVITAGTVLVLDRAGTTELAARAGLCLCAEPL